MSLFKAYIVSDDEESVVRYAQHAITARREGAWELDEDFSYVTCRRAKHFDQFYPAGPSNRDLFESGSWYFDCSLCNLRTVSRDSGMYSDGNFYCEACIDGFTSMREIRTPSYVSQFFGGDLVLGEDGQWHDVLQPVTDLPLKSYAQSPYVWYSPH